MGELEKKEERRMINSCRRVFLAKKRMLYQIKKDRQTKMVYYLPSRKEENGEAGRRKRT